MVIVDIMQGFRGLPALMESAIRATRESLGNLDHREIPVNWEARAFRGSVISPCVIRLTTSENITAKDPTSDDKDVRERQLLTDSARCWDEAIYCITVDSFLRQSKWKCLHWGQT